MPAYSAGIINADCSVFQAPPQCHSLSVSLLAETLTPCFPCTQCVCTLDFMGSL